MADLRFSLVERLNRIGITPVSIVIIYLFIGAGWVVYSDLLISYLVQNPEWFVIVQTGKDWIFLAGTGVVLLILLQQGIIALNTAREQAEEIAERQMVAESLRDILSALNSNQPIEVVLETIGHLARQVLHADGIAIYRLDPDRNVLSIQSSVGLPNDYTQSAEIPLGQVATGKAAETRKPAVITDVQTIRDGTLKIDPQRQRLLNKLSRYYRGVLSVPLVGQDDELIGTLTLYYKQPHEVSPYDVELAEIFANQTALAIVNTTLRQQIRQVVLSEERNRLARELHDSVTQTLYSILLYADAARIARDRGKEDLLEAHLKSLRGMAREAMTDMRLLIFELHPPILEQEGLEAALKTRLESVEARSGFSVQFNAGPLGQIPLVIETEIYRIAQEALNNVAKHAGAQHVQASLRLVNGGLELIIQDDGVGFDTSNSHGGMGIRSIQERAKNMGGRIEYHSIPGEGTRLVVWTPVERSNA